MKKIIIALIVSLIVVTMGLAPIMSYAADETEATKLVPIPVPVPLKIYPSDDATLSEVCKLMRNGTKVVLEVKSLSTNDNRAIMKFRLHSVEPVEIEKVEAEKRDVILHLFVCGATNELEIEIRPFLPRQSWDEESVSWYENDGEPWEYGGGKVSGPVITTFTVSEADIGKWIEVKLTHKQWQKLAPNGLLGGAGLVLKAVDEDCQWEKRSAKFKSNNTSTGKKPYITFE